MEGIRVGVRRQPGVRPRVPGRRQRPEVLLPEVLLPEVLLPEEPPELPWRRPA